MTSEPSFTHFDDDGNARMVDVGDKPVSSRIAIAKSRIRMRSETAVAIRGAQLEKGDVLGIARIAGIQAAKQTSSLIPLCHLIPLDKVQLEAAWTQSNELEWTAEVKATASTGVEMEALVAVSIAALTVYDMRQINRQVDGDHACRTLV